MVDIVWEPSKHCKRALLPNKNEPQMKGFAELIAPPMMSESSTNLPGKDVGKDAIPSKPVSSVSTVGNVGVIGAADQPLVSVQGVYYPPTTSYDYYYSGYMGTIAQPDDKGHLNTAGCSYMGMDNASLLYYLPGYGPFTARFVGVDGNQSYMSSEYLQQPWSYGSEPFPCSRFDLTYAAASRNPSMKSVSGSGKSNGFSTAKTCNNRPSNTSALPFHSKIQQPASHFSWPLYQNQSLDSLNKLGSGFQSSVLMRGLRPTGNFSSFTTRNFGVFMPYCPVNYQSYDRLWSNNQRYKLGENLDRNGEVKSKTELTRGPRAGSWNDSSKSPSELAFAIKRDEYNLKEFQMENNSAKFYIIKSYSEDDIHKSIKYEVWSSTMNGNKKLDAAFCETDAKTRESGTKCPVFLFFSVNGSGQFLGVAEMIGRVDFGKNMDFWQLDKWSGFFPIKWHIIKDVPNALFRHITLENNENRPVTYSRDTQEVEIGSRQGQEMLSIFKSYPEKRSILDDFDFYEHRTKAPKEKRNA